ncbi:NRPS-like enzyme [Penicillium brasilianum]|uniref:NRPS-like enzyme n=1 Tax=Penicillium brasilianum TaxID=104259 RepID=A0A1S9RQ34_PENBI|nr:NRPS-like enzyme [Penicillium brasilianum]
MEPTGRRLLSRVVDDAAQHEPERLFAVIPRGLNVSDGFQNLTMKELAHAVNSLCWWIEKTIGPAISRERLAYIGMNDVRYCVFVLACQKLGYEAFLPSTRNSDDAHVHLLKAADCTKIFFSEERRTRVLEIQGLCPNVEIFQIPTLRQMLADANGRRSYIYQEAYDDVENHTICIIHSSGTTGMPKLVPLTNGFFKCQDECSRLPWPESRQPATFCNYSQEEIVLATTPFFHLMGLFSFVMSIFHNVPVLIGPEKPLSVDYLVELIDKTRPTAGLFPPSVLEDMSHSEKALKSLGTLRSVFFGGAPLALDSGRRLRQHVQVVSVIGSSEMGWLPALIPESKEDWAYFEWNPFYGIEMQARGDDLFEMVIPRREDSRNVHAIFHTFPDRDVYKTNDLYTRHPTNPHLWKFHGRFDDVIVLSNGEKFNPVNMEKTIEGHPLVSRAVVVGQSRFEAGLLIQPTADGSQMSHNRIIEEVWPTVQEANRAAAAHGRILKERIGLASNTKPFKTTAKGTVQRQSVLRDYEQEINAIYDADLAFDLDVPFPETADSSSIVEFVRQIVSRASGKSCFLDNQNIHDAGLDSLTTIQIAKLLQRGLQQHRPETKEGTITSQVVYANPTVEGLARFILKILDGEIGDDIPRKEKIHRLIQKYTTTLTANSDKQLSSQPKPPSVVVLTGSTGSLGTYLLHDLIKNPTIAKVYCLNRSDAETRQKNSFSEKGLGVSSDEWAKIEFLQASLGEPQFDLERAKYEEMSSLADTVIHNAWKVDFNQSVESFETHIKGVRNFIDFSLQSRHNAHIHFVSSVSTVGAWTRQMGSLVPEEPIEDSDVALQQGYGESKYVAERICLEASRRCHVPTTVYRVGQIAGPTLPNGQWNRQEWLPTIIASSKAMGKIPSGLGSMAVDWVPVDTLSSILTEILHTRHGQVSKESHACFHLTNWNTTSWSSLIPTIRENLNVEPVGLREWVAELEHIENPSSSDIADKPALKLLSFYRALVDEENAAMSVALDVSRAKAASGTMRALEPISPALMKNWLSQWRF